MVFSDLNFLALFLPAFLLCYFISPSRYRNLILLMFSVIFYAWGEPIFVLLMVFSTILDYSVGIGLDKNRDNPAIKKVFLVISMVGNLGLLGLFKYSDFVIANLNLLLGSRIPLPNLILPIGISFYTFQTMSYSIDVYWGNVPAQYNFINFSTFVTMFPQLIAGPIVRYSDVHVELENRKESISAFAQGVGYFVLGLCHKVLLANSVGSLWTEMKNLPILNLSFASSWLGILAFTLQIYFDFGGYSLMAIGLGKMLGFNFPKNFDYPYSSFSVSEFWRRWHMTLGSWFREYVYIPLGGNRKGRVNTLRNLLIVWLLTGIWHGASWNFLLWGIYYGLLLILERFVYGKVLENTPKIIRLSYTLLAVIVGWVIFEAVDLTWGWQYLGIMFGAKGFNIDQLALYQFNSYGLVMLLGVVFSSPLPEKIKNYLCLKQPKLAAWLTFICIALGFWLVLAYIVDASYNPFLYFRF